MTAAAEPSATPALIALLRDCSVETVPGDRSLARALELLPAGTQVFIGSLPNNTIDQIVSAAVRVRASGLVPVPHLAARIIENAMELDEMLRRLSQEAAVAEVLVIGGDRSRPAGDYCDSLEIMQSGLLEKYGIRTVHLACYPEGHPRISDEKIDAALADKLVLAKQVGMDVGLVSQFCFEAAPIVRMAKRLRSRGIEAPLRVGLAGPTSRASLLKYAMKFGIGPSMRALSGRGGMARDMLKAEMPTKLIAEVADVQAADPELGISGVHLFTFGSAARSAEFVAEITSRNPR